MQSETPSIRIFNCDVMDGLAQLSDQSVDCVVTSDFRRARAALSPKKDTDTPETGDST